MGNEAKGLNENKTCSRMVRPVGGSILGSQAADLVPLAITDDRDFDYMDPKLRAQANLIVPTTVSIPGEDVIRDGNRESTWDSLAPVPRESGDWYEFLLPGFLAAMNDIGRYGHQKYGTDSFQHRRSIGDNSRGQMERTRSSSIAHHAKQHFEMYLRGEEHDHFGGLKHQLAATAFNAMMEHYFAGLEPKSPEPPVGPAFDETWSLSTWGRANPDDAELKELALEFWNAALASTPTDLNATREEGWISVEQKPTSNTLLLVLEWDDGHRAVFRGDFDGSDYSMSGGDWDATFRIRTFREGECGTPRRTPLSS